MDERDLQDWLEQTFDPDFDVDAFEDVRDIPGIGYENENEMEADMPQSELERLKQRARPDTVVQGAHFDNVVEAFVEVDGQHWAILINMDHLRESKHPGLTVSATAIKVDA